MDSNAVEFKEVRIRRNLRKFGTKIGEILVLNLSKTHENQAILASNSSKFRKNLIQSSGILKRTNLSLVK